MTTIINSRGMLVRDDIPFRCPYGNLLCNDHCPGMDIKIKPAYNTPEEIKAYFYCFHIARVMDIDKIEEREK